MNSSLRIAMAAGAIAWAAGCVSGKSKKQVGPEQTLSIQLYNEAGVNAATLHWATVEADRLFRVAAIEINWEQGPVLGEGVCTQTTKPYIVMHLMRKAPMPASPGALGSARLFSQTGSQVLIYFDRLEVLRRSMNVEGYIILGHVMAHEIGHVLLASSQHSSSGLMEAHWNTMSWRLASAGLLGFGREEAERMNAALARLRNCTANSSTIASNPSHVGRLCQ